MSAGSKISLSIKNYIMAKKHNYRVRLKREGKLEELKDYNKQVAQSVSDSIMSNDKERSRRSELLGKLNKRDDFRKKASETAIKTSARPEIQKQRAENLKRWRDDNPEKFLEIIQKAHTYKSKPEKMLTEFVQCRKDGFRSNQQLKHAAFAKTHKTQRKQIDCLNKQKKIVVEFDGHFHFRNIKKWNQLKDVQATDAALNSLKDEFCIVRVSHDQFSYRKHDGGFKQGCLQKLEEILSNPQPGLYCLGEAYGQSNIL